MKIFLSWSGKESLGAATVFKELLPCMNQDLVPFLSQHDIESGARWSLRIAEELEETDFGILFLTPTNLSSDWLLFEAGALTKHLNGRAAGVLLGGLSPRDVSGPLSQFQHCVFTKDNIGKLFTSILKISQSNLEAHQATRIIDKWWSDFESAISELEFVDEISDKDTELRDDNAVLEEILMRVRALENSTLSDHRKSSDQPDYKMTYGKAIHNLLNALSEEQKNVLSEIAKYKIEGNQSGLKGFIDTVSVDVLDNLYELNLLKKSENRIVAINRMIADSLYASRDDNEP